MDPWGRLRERWSSHTFVAMCRGPSLRIFSFPSLFKGVGSENWLKSETDWGPWFLFFLTSIRLLFTWPKIFLVLPIKWGGNRLLSVSLMEHHEEVTRPCLHEWGYSDHWSLTIAIPTLPVVAFGHKLALLSRIQLFQSLGFPNSRGYSSHCEIWLQRRTIVELFQGAGLPS